MGGCELEGEGRGRSGGGGRVTGGGGGGGALKGGNDLFGGNASHSAEDWVRRPLLGRRDGGVYCLKPWMAIMTLLANGSCRDVSSSSAQCQRQHSETLIIVIWGT